MSTRALYDPAATLREGGVAGGGGAGIPARGWNFRWVARSPSVLPGTGGQGGSLAERILDARGLRGHAEFLTPSLNQLCDPSLIPDLDRAATRLLLALEQGEPIVIYGDYDVDGITATAILFHTLRAIRPGARVETHVPHRDEGYGLNSDALTQFAGRGIKVVVTVDCGITAIEPADRALELGIDLIITDHHNPPADGEALPRAFAVVHPRRPGSAYPFGDLSGAGVAYKLAWRLATMHAGSTENSAGGRASPAMRGLLLDLLALACLGTVADIVPLHGENRVLARFGMERIRSSAFEGLRALVRASGLEGEKVSTYDIGFKLGPRLNAGGRMAHARDAVELLTTATGERAAILASQLNNANNDRRTAERAIAAQAAQGVIDAGMADEARRAIVLSDTPAQPWLRGVIGIVCSRLVDRFNRPTVLLCHDPDSPGVLHGSARSIPDFNLHAALAQCADLLVQFGGHNMAAGLKIEVEKLDSFVSRFTEVCNAEIDKERLVRLVTVDAITTPDELTLAAAQGVESLAPFGQGNPEPVILIRNGRLASAPVSLGSTGEHLALSVVSASGKCLRVVAWGWGKHKERLPAGLALDTLMRLRLNTFRGRTTVEGELVDIMPIG
ncbi:MAG: single-stranded-DNA-specific exonuclease RecJ [Phycisphaerales bacterium]